MFQQNFFPKKRLRRARRALDEIDWSMLGYWKRWCQQVHPMEDTSGPDTHKIRDRTGLFAVTCRQKNVARWTPTTRLPQDLAADVADGGLDGADVCLDKARV